jgi:glucose-6-phosphate dehydrogenase assembly protein OpcA
VSATREKLAAGWRGEPVALADVGRTLEHRRQELEEEGHVRARVATLLVVTDDVEGARAAVEVVEAVEGRNPSRCVVLVIRPPQPEPGVRAWAKVTPRPGRGVPGLRDEVVVEAAIPPGHLAAVVLPLLLPDIPVFTWWLGTPPFGEEVADDLLAVTDRLIVDSAAFADPVGDLGRLAGALEGLPPASDCVWGRLTPWRELLASSFAAPPLRRALERVTEVRITAVQPTAGPLLAGWLAARLGWTAQPGGPGGDRVTYRSGGGEVTVQLRQGEAAASSTLAAVEVQSAAAAPVATVLLRAHGPHVVASSQVGQAEARQTRIGQCGMSMAQALRSELEVFGRDRVFEEALAATRPWTGGGR